MAAQAFGPGHFEPQSRTELNAFATRLVDIAVDIDIQRGIEYGLARLAELDGVELCSFLRRVVQSGELSLLADGWRCRTAAS